MNLKEDYESERQRFFSRIDPDNPGPDPYQLKQRQADYSDMVKDRMAVEKLNQNKKIKSQNTLKKNEGADLETSVRVIINNLQKSTRNSRPIEQ